MAKLTPVYCQSINIFPKYEFVLSTATLNNDVEEVNKLVSTVPEPEVVIALTYAIGQDINPKIIEILSTYPLKNELWIKQRQNIITAIGLTP